MTGEPGRTEIAIAVVACGGRFLIGLRPDHVPLAGHWEFPGGKVEPGESPAAAAARECFEETGLAVRIEGPYPEVVHDYDHARLRLHFYRASPEQPAPPPRPPFRWVPLGELAGLRFPEANRGLIAHLLCHANAAGA